MNQGKFVLSQLMALIDPNDFNKCVDRYNGNYRVQKFTCWHQLVCMVFGQLAGRESLRDTVTCLMAQSKKLYHFGITKGVAKSTLAEANESRDWRIYADFAQVLIAEANDILVDTNETGLDLKNAIYALDATTIDLCLNVFGWAHFRQEKAAIKLHTLLDLKRGLPSFIYISDGLLHEVNTLDMVPLEADAIYVMDRGYNDFGRLYLLHKAKSFFVIRAKKGMLYKRVYSSQKAQNDGIICDQTIRLTGKTTSVEYPELLRRVKYYDKELDRTFVFLTNNFEITAAQVAALYKNRWKIELFFKWIKQHLKIKAFWGTSKNAVHTQIWIAVISYTLVAILRKKLNVTYTYYEILQILSVSLFDKTPLNQLLGKQDLQNPLNEKYNQLNLFDL